MAQYDLRSTREIMDEAVERLRYDLVDCDSGLQLAQALGNFQRRYDAVKDRLSGAPWDRGMVRAQQAYEALKPLFEVAVDDAGAGDGRG